MTILHFQSYKNNFYPSVYIKAYYFKFLHIIFYIVFSPVYVKSFSVKHNIKMKNTRTNSIDCTEMPLYKDIMEIPKQYLHIHKNFSRVSPLRNRKILEKIRNSHNGSWSNSIQLPKHIPNSPKLEECYMKILKKACEDKENSTRYFSLQKQRILSEIPDIPPSSMRIEQEEALISYKNTQMRIKTLVKNKLPPSVLKYKKDV